MDRLTNRVNEVVIYKGELYSDTTAAEMSSNDIRKCLALLADYEDLGYTPQELLLVIGKLEGIEIPIGLHRKDYVLINIINAKNKIYKYRKMHPKCKYCIHSKLGIFLTSCSIKMRITLPRETESCGLYEPTNK